MLRPQFSTPRFGWRYRKPEVDAFVERVLATAGGRPIGPPVTVRELQRARLPTTLRGPGYSVTEVDVFLDKAEDWLARPQRPAADEFPRPEFTTVRLHEGYDTDDVDAFVERLMATVEGRPVDRPVTPDEIPRDRVHPDPNSRGLRRRRGGRVSRSRRGLVDQAVSKMSSMGVAIREFRETDRAAVLALAPRLTEGVAAWRDPDAVGRAVVGWVEGSIRSGTVFVAEIGGDVVGFVSASTREHWSGGSDAYIGELVVDRAAGGRGAGRALVAAVEVWAAKRGLTRLTLETGAANATARAFYRQLGFAEEDIRLTRLLD